MKLKQFTIALENKHGLLYEVTRSLGDAGINMRALNLVDTGGFGQIRLLVSDVAATRRLLMEKMWPAREDEVVAVEIADQPGSLADLLAHLYTTDVSVIYAYAYVGMVTSSAVMIFKFNDNDKALQILEAKGVKLLGADVYNTPQKLDSDLRCKMNESRAIQRRFVSGKHSQKS